MKLGTILTEVHLDKSLPTMWKEFEALVHLPVMVIRGGSSDILSAATVAAMQARHSALQVVEVPDQGHAPLLAEAESAALRNLSRPATGPASDSPDDPVPMPDHRAVDKDGPPAVARRGLEVEPKIARSGDHG